MACPPVQKNTSEQNRSIAPNRLFVRPGLGLVAKPCEGSHAVTQPSVHGSTSRDGWVFSFPFSPQAHLPTFVVDGEIVVSAAGSIRARQLPPRKKNFRPCM